MLTIPRNNFCECGLHPHCRQHAEAQLRSLGDFSSREAFMSMILTFAGTWGRWYRVLRYAKAFSFVASVRYGLWLARS